MDLTNVFITCALFTDLISHDVVSAKLTLYMISHSTRAR